MDVLLPATDGGALAQAWIVATIGALLLIVALVRRAHNAAWLVAGLLTASVGFFVLRAAH